MIMASSLSSSLTVCLFPPFYPRLAEMKGATATDYGLIIGTNCLVAFITTPYIGSNLGSIGVKFAFVFGLFGGGCCCALSGFLEFFQPGTLFIVMSVLVRICHAIANALVITSTFTYTACEFPSAVAKIFSVTR
jgi:MFS family permease